MYKKFVDNLPIACVDLIVINDGKYLLLKRALEPLKGEWFVPGGRILKDEPLLAAAYRIAMRETGLIIRKLTFAGFYEDRYPVSAHGVPTHTISIVFECNASGDVVLDSQSEDWKWATKLPDRLTEKICKLDGFGNS